MQKTANNVLSLFLTEFTSFKLRNINHTELYRRLGKRIIALADHALELRQTDNAYVLSEMLNNMPGNFRHIGRYYQAMCLKRKGQVAQARNLLEHVAQNQDTPLSYRARALHAIGATYYEADTPIEALRYYLEAARAGSFANDIFSTTQSHWMIAVLKSVDGDHKRALIELENLLPQIQYIATSHPVYFYIYQNSLAVERAEVGEIQAAQHASRIALASSFAHAYPEWQQTGTDVYERTRSSSRSVIKVPAPNNLFFIPPAFERVVQSPPLRLGKLFDLAEYKNKMVKEPNDEPEEDVDQMDRKDLLVKLLELTAQINIDEEKLRKVVKYTIEIMGDKK